MSNENNIKIKDPEGREYDDSGSATLKKVISVICVIFSLVGIITNSIYPLTGMKKGGIFLRHDLFCRPGKVIPQRGNGFGK